MLDINDVDSELLDYIKYWLTVYKIPQGKQENKFGYNGEFQNSVKITFFFIILECYLYMLFTLLVTNFHSFFPIQKRIQELMTDTHCYWKALVNGTTKSEIST